MRMEVVRACLLCGIDGEIQYSGLWDRMTDVPGEWPMRRCPVCGLLWLDARPDKSDIGKVYLNAYCTHAVNETNNPSGWIKRCLLAGFGYGMKSFPRLAGRILCLLPMLRDVAGGDVMWLDAKDMGKLLDVGCGNGSFLARMKELGWDASGIDPDPVSANIARESFGIDVMVGRLEDMVFPSGSFQAVTLRHVVEHVHDPVGLLRECWRLLSPGGRLVSLTPNSESLGHKVFKRDWSELDPPRHLHVFCPKTLSETARLAGITGFSVRSTSRAARWIFGPSVSIRKTGKSARESEFGRGRFAFWAAEEVVRALFDSYSGEELVLSAEKKAVPA